MRLLLLKDTGYSQAAGGALKEAVENECKDKQDCSGSMYISVSTHAGLNLISFEATGKNSSGLKLLKSIFERWQSFSSKTFGSSLNDLHCSSELAGVLCMSPLHE